MNLNLNLLRKRCKMTKIPGKQVSSGLWYIDRQADILGVAHLDYVPQTRHFCTVRIIPGNYHVVYSGQLDNRLGVYTLLDVLRVSGIEFDVLLTTDEEACQSTARQFVTDKDYKWGFSFDRSGTQDVAMYQYLDDQTSDAIRQVGLLPAHGSYSDIVELEHLGCKMFNWCNGLVNGHSPEAHASTRDYLSCVYKFLEFYKVYHDVYMPHTPQDRIAPWGDDILDQCDWCNRQSLQMQYLDGFWVCSECAQADRWLDECWLCGRITTVEYQKEYDSMLCEPCLTMLKGR